MVNGIARFEWRQAPVKKASLGNFELRVAAKLGGKGMRVSAEAPTIFVSRFVVLFCPPTLEIGQKSCMGVFHVLDCRRVTCKMGQCPRILKALCGQLQHFTLKLCQNSNSLLR